MKKLLLVLICFLMVFIFIACKSEPNQNNKPAQDTEYEDDSTVYVLTATSDSDRFQFKWDELEKTGGKVFELKYKSEKSVAEVTTRDPASADKYVNCASAADYISEPDDSGWITFTFPIPEGDHEGFGVAFFVTGGVVEGDVFKIKAITLSDDEEAVELPLGSDNSWAGCEPTITVEE